MPAVRRSQAHGLKELLNQRAADLLDITPSFLEPPYVFLDDFMQPRPARTRRMLKFSGTVQGAAGAYEVSLRDEYGNTPNITTIRGIPVPAGVATTLWVKPWVNTMTAGVKVSVYQNGVNYGPDTMSYTIPAGSTSAGGDPQNRDFGSVIPFADNNTLAVVVHVPAGTAGQSIDLEVTIEYNEGWTGYYGSDLWESLDWQLRYKQGFPTVSTITLQPPYERGGVVEWATGTFGGGVEGLGSAIMTADTSADYWYLSWRFRPKRALLAGTQMGVGLADVFGGRSVYLGFWGAVDAANFICAYDANADGSAPSGHLDLAPIDLAWHVAEMYVKGDGFIRVRIDGGNELSAQMNLSAAHGSFLYRFLAHATLYQAVQTDWIHFYGTR